MQISYRVSVTRDSLMKTIKRCVKKKKAKHNETAERNRGRKEREMKGKREKKKGKSIALLDALLLVVSFALSPLPPSHSTPFGENNDKAFPSISDYFDFAQVPPCLAKKGRSFRVDRDLFRSLHRERFAYHESLFSVPFFVLLHLPRSIHLLTYTYT